MMRRPITISARPELLGPARVLAGLGAAVLAAGAFLAPERVWPGLLVAGLFTTGLGLAGLVYVAIHYATGAGWDVAVRRVAEGVVGLVPAGAVLALVAVAAGGPTLYPWWDAGHGAAAGEHAFGPFKTWWLTPGFFLARSALYAIVWTAFALVLRRLSRRQDGAAAGAPGPVRLSGAPSGAARRLDPEPARGLALRRRATTVSAAFLPVFAVTSTLATVDWAMSLEPHWYSTIYGVYHFAGLFVAGLSALILLTVLLQRSGALAGRVTAEHLHDLGKLLFAMTTFWAYIWFSQYMLIWYGNLAEEVTHFTLRSEGPWAPLFWVNPIVGWVVPFLVLLPRAPKRDATALCRVAGLLLVAHALDLYLAVYPPLHPGGPVFGGWEAGIVLGTVALIALVLHRALAGAPGVPVGDPFLAESLYHHG